MGGGKESDFSIEGVHNTGMPRKLELQFEIDYWHWQLGNMLERSRSQQPIETMIDQATGYDKAQLRKAQTIIEHVRKLRKEYEAL